MSGISKTFEHMQLLRRKFETLVAEGQGAGTWSQAGPTVTQLQSMRSFGTNPGDLKMLVHVPDRLAPSPALVVALHGCGQNAAVYERGTGWSELADRLGFVVVYPEQQAANNPKSCFSWFQPGDAVRDMGEAASIRQMVEHAIGVFKIDRSRIYVTGLSAGGAMTSVMLAAHPEMFAAGAIIAGLPYGSATNMQQAFEAMFSDRIMETSVLAERVRAASAHSGPWPRVSIWHGSADTIVKPSNALNIVRQWTAVHGLDGVLPRVEAFGPHERRVWGAHGSAARVEWVSIDGMGHGVPVAPASAAPGSGRSGPFFLDAGVPSTLHIARFWGIEGAEELAEVHSQVVHRPQSPP